MNTLNEKEWNTPVLILSCDINSLAIMRTLGRFGVPLHAIHHTSKVAELKSRYLKKWHPGHLEQDGKEAYLNRIISVGKQLGRGTILIPTNDKLAHFVAAHREPLHPHFVFQDNPEELILQLTDKQKMHDLALENGIPTPQIIVPASPEELERLCSSMQFPVMLKGKDGIRLEKRFGIRMQVIHSKGKLLTLFKKLHEPADPNLMIQEYIPGDDKQVYMFNGYFNDESECLAGFTGHKIRQYPIHKGCTSLGVCIHNRDVYQQTVDFMKNINYKGVLDIGYRFDHRDGLYKVLDINPRIGWAFRLFTARNGADVVTSLYLDLTGQKLPEMNAQEGRRWAIEDFDLIASVDYFREGTLTLRQWSSSFRGLEETAWFCRKDPKPFFVRMFHFFTKSLHRLVRRLTKKIN